VSEAFQQKNDKQKLKEVLKTLGFSVRSTKTSLFVPGREYVFNSYGEIKEIRDYINLRKYTEEGSKEGEML
jgi:hypothetical protein